MGETWKTWVRGAVRTCGIYFLTHLGSIILCGLAIIVTLGLIWRSELKKAAVGRRCAGEGYNLEEALTQQ